MPSNPLPAQPSPFDRLLWPLLNRIFSGISTNDHGEYSPLLRNLGNILSLARLLSAVVFVVFWFTLPTTQPLSAIIWVLLAVSWAGLTDALDGVFARYFKNSSGSGAILDPAMDKIAIFAFFITWVVVGLKINELYAGIVLASLLTRMVIEGALISQANKELSLTGHAQAGSDGKLKTGVDILLVMPFAMLGLIIGHMSFNFVAVSFMAIASLVMTCLLGLKAISFHKQNIRSSHELKQKFSTS
jgi:phosphatidylglycerophosphate synthase